MSTDEKKTNIVILDMQPITPPIGGGRLRLLGLYSGFSDEFTATYVGSYDWRGESFREIQVSPCLKEIDIPLSEKHFIAHDELSKKVGQSCIDTAFLIQGNLSQDYIERACIEVNKADIVIFSHPWIYPFVKHLLKKESQLIVYDAHNNEYLLRSKLIGQANEESKKLIQNVKYYEEELCKFSDIILVCSKEDRETFSNIYNINKEKCILTPNGVFTNNLYPCKTNEEKEELRKKLGLYKPSICFIGSMYYPNIEACRTIIKIAKKLPEYQFIIIGGVGEALSSKEVENIENVIVCGTVTENEKIDWLRGCDIAINPMYSGSGTNIKMFDFMAAGLPILTTKCGARGIPNIDDKLYIEIKDSVEDIISSIKDIFRNKKDMIQYAKNARKIVENKYSWERISFELGFKLKQLYKLKKYKAPFFSIVIPTYERHSLLTRLIKKIKNQTFKDFEIIIIDQSKNVWKDKDIFNLSNILYCKTKIRGAVHARNTGIFLSNGQVVAFIDDDCIPEENWLHNAKEYFNNSINVGIEGRIYADNYDTSKYRVVSNEGFEGIGFMTANLFIRSDILKKIDGFDERFDSPHFREDTDLAWRALEFGAIPYGTDVSVLHPSHLRDIQRESIEERNKFFVHDPLLLKKHYKKFIELFKREGHFQNPDYWKYFQKGMIIHNISQKQVINFLTESHISKDYYPIWEGDFLDVSELNDINRNDSKISIDIENNKYEYKKFSEHDFYNFIRYRILYHICFGNLKNKYKIKYKNIKNYIKNSKKEKIYFLGIHIITKIYIQNIIGIYFFHIPFITYRIYKEKIRISMFGIEVYKKKIFKKIINKNNNVITYKKKLCIDITNLAAYDYGSGIQRVEKNILFYAMNANIKNFDVFPVYFDGKNYKIANSFLKKFKKEFCETDDIIYMNKNDIIILPELIFQEYYWKNDFIYNLLNNGVYIYAILYDLIPLQYPQYCSEDSIRIFNDYIQFISKLSGVITDSKSIAKEYIDWRCINIKNKNNKFYINWFHLGADIEKSFSTYGIPEDASKIFESMNKRYTLLEVSTVEPRKGHKQALAAFEKLWNEGIDINFVIVGKKGWKMEKFSEKIINHKEYNKRLFWLQNISDEYLNKVYKYASGIIFPSEAEGFGLAVIEGAIHKKPLILRDIPVFREIAGDNATYFSGQDVDSLANCIKQWIYNYENNRVISSSKIKVLTWKESINMLLSRIPALN